MLLASHSLVSCATFIFQTRPNNLEPYDYLLMVLNLSTYSKYPQEARRLIYTTNAIEGFNRQLRKVTKAKSVFPSDDSLLKMLYLAMMDITKK